MLSRPRLGSFFLASFFCLLASFPSSWVVVVVAVYSSSLDIYVPNRLYTDGGYAHRNALFGFPTAPGFIAQTVYYANDTLCHPVVDRSKAPWPAPFILMLDRGGCTFVQKVRNAQHAGAAAALIADNTCLCSDTDCTSDQPCEPTEPIVADDGSGSDISIPSMLVFKTDADAIKAELMLQDNSVVFAKMSWTLTNPSSENRVEYEIWTTPLDAASTEFWETFAKYANALGPSAYFTPHMYIYDGIRAGCQGPNGENVCKGLCTNHGRYCALDSDVVKGVKGTAIVAESLRRLCVWMRYGNDDGIGQKWWKYMEEFHSRCAGNADFFSSNDCVKDVYHHAGIDGYTIERCMKDSGGLEGDVSNNKLDMEIAAQAANGVVMIPTVTVNRVPVRERVSHESVFNAICRGFEYTGMPSVCRCCANCPNLDDCVNEGICRPSACNGGAAQHEQTTIVTPLRDESPLLDATALLIPCVALLLLLVAALTALYFQKRRWDVGAGGEQKALM